MKYIDAIKGSGIAALFFVLFVRFLPGFGPTPLIETMLTIATFLFAILAGFFISRLNSRYNEIRELMSNEDAYLFSLYKMAQVFGQPFVNKISDKIDYYYMASFENDIANYYKATMPHLQGIYETVFSLKAKSANSTYANLLSMLSSIEVVRNKNSVIAQERLTHSQWGVLIFLTVIVLFCLFYLNTGEFYFQFLLVVLSTILVLVLLTMRDLQNLRLGGELMPILESGQEVLEAMGKLRYYHRDLVDAGIMKIPPGLKTYRLGIHPLHAKSHIKIVKR
ncbi:MAG: hypothetical protein ACD_28C00006G0001 [uncultured bacterium]|nr:MAG: hypothetical protein ACD_28C00006G0001 [uncultured bacterium]KKT75697.1 MAG: hypothetical protein UW70_C0030G0016 [Candidatus Peregrinibacteria bacterium GW2011_GWA2_44_7]